MDEPKRAHVREFLSSDRTPMWVTLCFLAFGAAGTYVLAPHVNAQFEAQKVRTDFVNRNYGDLRTKMEDFQGVYLVATQKIASGDDVKAELYRLQEIIGRINAQTLSFMPIFTTEAGPKAMLDLASTLNAMLAVLRNHEGDKFKSAAELEAFNAEVMQAGKGLARPLLELYIRIGQLGNLSPTEKDRDLAKH